jgi:SAM-dependent methyltransferase
MPRAPGRVRADGNEEYAEPLMAALRAPMQDHETAESLTHPFHSYPARLHPATARVLVGLVAEGAPRAQPILDPFCGSGTTLVEARAIGHAAIGTDLNPLAVLVARAKTWVGPTRRRGQLREGARELSAMVVAAGKAARRAGAEPPPLRKPQGWDPNARDRRLKSWFAPHVRRELELLASYLDELRPRDAELADVLTACLSAILYKVSSRTSDTDGTWVDRNVARGAAARLFAQRGELLAAGLDDMSNTRGAMPVVHERDVRRITDVVPNGSVAGIVTSPPYAGTYDYAEHQRLRFDFLALHHRDMDEGEIGSRRSFEKDPAGADAAWRLALAEALGSIARTLAPGRLAAIVLGDSVARGRGMFALDDVREALAGPELAGAMVLEAWASQERPMLGAVERRAFGERGKAEHVILLRRSV